MRVAGWLSFALLVLCLPSCIHPHHPHGMPPGQAKKVVHVHGVHCGHVLVDDHWIDHGKGPGKSKRH